MKSCCFTKEKLTSRALLLAAAAFGAAMLAAALVAQYGFGLHPCELCMLQRYPYIALVLLGVAGAVLVKNPRGQRVVFYGCVLLLLVDAGIASYHAAVEFGWVKGPEACSGDGGTGQTIEEIRAAILGAPLVSCSQAMAYVFGLSLAAWNALLALFAAAVLVIKGRSA